MERARARATRGRALGCVAFGLGFAVWGGVGGGGGKGKRRTWCVHLFFLVGAMNSGSNVVYTSLSGWLWKLHLVGLEKTHCLNARCLNRTTLSEGPLPPLLKRFPLCSFRAWVSLQTFRLRTVSATQLIPEGACDMQKATICDPGKTCCSLSLLCSSCFFLFCLWGMPTARWLAVCFSAFRWARGISGLLRGGGGVHLDCVFFFWGGSFFFSDGFAILPGASTKHIGGALFWGSERL